MIEEHKKTETEGGTENGNQSEVISLKKELKKTEKSKKYIETEYFKCEEELKRKTAEVENLKTEIKDLKQIIDLDNFFVL